MDQLRGLRRRRRQQQVDPRVVLDHDLADEVDIDRRRGHEVDDALAIEPEIEEDAVVAELQVAIDQCDLAPELAMERDRGVDRDGRRPHPALGAVERQGATERRPGEQRFARCEAGEQALDPGQQLRRVERLDEVVVGARAQAADLLLDLPLGGEHDDRNVAGGALLGPDLGRDLVAVELGQHDVEQDQVGRLGSPQAESLRAIGRDDDVVAFLLERVLQEPLYVRVVVDDEDLGRHQSSMELAGWSMSAGSRFSGDHSPGWPIIGIVPWGEVTSPRRTQLVTRRRTRRRGGSTSRAGLPPPRRLAPRRTSR